MKLHILLSILVAVHGARAQTSEGFPFDVANYLPVDFSNTSTLYPGVLYNVSTVLNAPTVGLPQNVTPSSQPYLILMYDPDVVINNTATSVLHWLQPNLYSSRSAGTLTFNADGANASSVEGASYLTPQPPANQIHHYNILLFNQPANFTVPSQFADINPPQSIPARIGFNITDFVRSSGLSDPIAANYFRILLNATAEATASALTMTATSGVAFASETSTMTSLDSMTESGSTVSGTKTSTGATSTGSAASSTSSKAAAVKVLDSAVGVVAEVYAAAAVLGWWVL